MYRCSVEIRLLGGLEVLDDNGAQVEVPGAKRRTLLAALALRPGQVVSSEQLVEAIWGEHAGGTAANSLQALVSKLRRSLPANVVSTHGGGYALELRAESIDIGRFEAIALKGRKALSNGEAESARALFREALGLWRGSALSEFAYDEFAQIEITRLSEERASVLEDRIDADMLAGRHGEIVAELEAVVAAEPLRERLRGQLMLALYRSGRQADALRQFQEARRVLGEELGLEPGPELRRLEAAILVQEPDLAAVQAIPVGPETVQSRRTNLHPPPTETIGREDDLASLLALTSAHRLVTVVGAGGVGKTRLAIETGLVAGQAFRDGAWFIELAPLRDRAVVVPIIAATLGIAGIQSAAGASDPPSTRLAEILAEREMLLILDNCEHLVDESARVATELLASCPRLRLIATSRERLGVAGEYLWPAPSLTPERAAALFALRAAEVAPGFALSEETGPIVRSICERLDGMPLAIELAAARTRAFPVGQIAERLGDRFRLLTGGPRTAAQRQQTLRAVVDWSCDLLSDPERRLFYRLSVFIDGSDLEAVEAVCADELVARDDVADLLARLVDKSLVVWRDEDGRARFFLLQTLAEYGRERIAEVGERDVLRGRHAVWYGTVADGGIPAMFGREQRRWLRTVRRELGNLRQALDWSVDIGDAELAQSITGNLGVFFWASGHLELGLRWLDAALGCSGSSREATRGLALTWKAFLSLIAGRSASTDEVDEAIRALDAGGETVALALAEQLGTATYARVGKTEAIPSLFSRARDHFVDAASQDSLYESQVLWSGGLAAKTTGDYETGLRDLRAFLAHPGNTSELLEVIMLGHVADMCEARGEYAQALHALETASTLAQELRMDGFDVPIRARLANLALLSGEPDRAWALRQEAVEVARQTGCLPVLAGTLAGIASHQLRNGHPAAAAAAAADALVVSREIDNPTDSALALIVLGWTAEAEHDGRAAEAWFGRGLIEARRADDSILVRDAAEGLAAVALLAEDAIRAARLLGAASKLRADRDDKGWDMNLLTGSPMLSTSGAADQLRHKVRTQLGPTAFEAAFATGDPEDLLHDEA
jgi:predicted ATPase/DNA-binding SARP family transcriptional activator